VCSLRRSFFLFLSFFLLGLFSLRKVLFFHSFSFPQSLSLHFSLLTVSVEIASSRPGTRPLSVSLTVASCLRKAGPSNDQWKREKATQIGSNRPPERISLLFSLTVLLWVPLIFSVPPVLLGRSHLPRFLHVGRRTSRSLTEIRTLEARTLVRSSGVRLELR